MDNIAYQLFLDVIKFHANNNIHSMGYMTEVKEFWALGYKLFRGKFIRFMGGYKASGRLDVEAVEKNLRRTRKLDLLVPMLMSFVRKLILLILNVINQAF